jgi:hypothetical protein
MAFRSGWECENRIACPGRSPQESRMRDSSLHKAGPYKAGLYRVGGYGADKRGTLSSTLLLLVVGTLVVFPEAPAMARGKAVVKQNTAQTGAMPMSISSIIKSAEGQPSTTTKSTVAGTPTMAIAPLSPTTMASPPGNPTTMRSAPSPTAVALPTLIPSLMATSPLSPGRGMQARTAIVNSTSHYDFRNVKHASTSTSSSWPSSGAIWPTAAPVDASVKSEH